MAPKSPCGPSGPFTNMSQAAREPKTGVNSTEKLATFLKQENQWLWNEYPKLFPKGGR